MSWQHFWSFAARFVSLSSGTVLPIRTQSQRQVPMGRQRCENIELNIFRSGSKLPDHSHTLPNVYATSCNFANRPRDMEVFFCFQVASASQQRPGAKTDHATSPQPKFAKQRSLRVSLCATYWPRYSFSNWACASDMFVQMLGFMLVWIETKLWPHC